MEDASELEIACSLSEGEYQGRLEEFSNLFASSLTAYYRQPSRLHLVFASGPGVEEASRDLLRREAECCTFFNFAVTSTQEGFEVEAKVPDAAAECLDELERLALDALGESTVAKDL